MELTDKKITIYLDKPNQALPIYLNDLSDAIKVNSKDAQVLREIYGQLSELQAQVKYHEFRLRYPELSRKPNNMEKTFEEFQEARNREGL